MSKEQKKFQKKKDRERRVRRQVLLEREAIRAPEREERKFQKKLKRVERLKKDMGRLNVWADELFLKMDDKTLSQLEHNAKILKALEEEYRDEHDRKVALNEELEAKGVHTLEEKLEHLHGRIVEQAKELYKSGGLEAEVVEEASKRADVAEVEVVRAAE